jgi:hypothetical protein
MEQKYSYEQAVKDIHELLDKKVVLPKRREAMEDMKIISSVAEAISLGYVGINSDGTITQRMIHPESPQIELVYKQHVKAELMNKSLNAIKNLTQQNINLEYICMYTGKSASEVNRLEPVDRNVADSIAFFFQ